MQAYTDALITSDEFREQFGNLRHLTIKGNRSKSKSVARVGDGIICISDRMRDEQTLLHEIAHHITWNQPAYIKNNQQAHGAWYAYILLMLVRMKMGNDAAEKLANAFDAHKVQWREGKERFEEMQWFNRTIANKTGVDVQTQA